MGGDIWTSKEILYTQTPNPSNTAEVRPSRIVPGVCSKFWVVCISFARFGGIYAGFREVVVGDAVAIHCITYSRSTEVRKKIPVHIER